MTSDGASWLAALAGRFIVFDGPDGCGKTTQCQRFAREAADAGVPVCLVRDPGGTEIGEQIRNVLLSTDNHDMDVRCEMLLYMASRAQLVAEHVAPALQQGELVLADRFISSTLAYQGVAGGVARSDILDAGRIAVGRCWPDLVVLFDLDEPTATARRRRPPDRIEQKDAAYHRAVRQAFLDQAHADEQRYLVVDAGADPDTVFQRLLLGLERKAAGCDPEQ